MKNYKKSKGCDHSICLIGCCFEENTIIKVLENNKEISKPIKKYEDDFEFYEIKAKLGDKVKTIVVTGNHIMICYDKNMSQARYMTAENVTKNDYFYTVDGLYQIYEINIKTKKNKYSLGVEEGAIMASDILVTCFNYNEVNRKLSIVLIIMKSIESYPLMNYYHLIN